MHYSHLTADEQSARRAEGSPRVASFPLLAAALNAMAIDNAPANFVRIVDRALPHAAFVTLADDVVERVLAAGDPDRLWEYLALPHWPPHAYGFTWIELAVDGSPLGGFVGTVPLPDGGSMHCGFVAASAEGITRFPLGKIEWRTDRQGAAVSGAFGCEAVPPDAGDPKVLELLERISLPLAAALASLSDAAVKVESHPLDRVARRAVKRRTGRYELGDVACLVTYREGGGR